MNVAMMQPAFLPWQGFFELIYRSDIFVILDDFQFSPQSYHQRNKLFVSAGTTGWYTVPVQKAHSFGAPLNAAQIDERSPWRKKFLTRLQHNYGKTLFFEPVFSIIENRMAEPTESLAALNVRLIKSVIELLGWNRELRFSSEYYSDKTRSELVLELLRWCRVSRYFAAAGSYGYMREDAVFPVSDIELQFQNFQPDTYIQQGVGKDFIPYLSIFDALFNVGPLQTRLMVENGTKNWRQWDVLLESH